MLSATLGRRDFQRTKRHYVAADFTSPPAERSPTGRVKRAVPRTDSLAKAARIRTFPPANRSRQDLGLPACRPVQRPQPPSTPPEIVEQKPPAIPLAPRHPQNSPTPPTHRPSHNGRINAQLLDHYAHQNIATHKGHQRAVHAVATHWNGPAASTSRWRNTSGPQQLCLGHGPATLVPSS